MGLFRHLRVGAGDRKLHFQLKNDLLDGFDWVCFVA
jgi:hypothetical protein